MSILMYLYYIFQTYLVEVTVLILFKVNNWVFLILNNIEYFRIMLLDSKVYNINNLFVDNKRLFEYYLNIIGILLEDLLLYIQTLIFEYNISSEFLIKDLANFNLPLDFLLEQIIDHNIINIKSLIHMLKILMEYNNYNNRNLNPEILLNQFLLLLNNYSILLKKDILKEYFKFYKIYRNIHTINSNSNIGKFEISLNNYSKANRTLKNEKFNNFSGNIKLLDLMDNLEYSNLYNNEATRNNLIGYNKALQKVLFYNNNIINKENEVELQARKIFGRWSLFRKDMGFLFMNPYYEKIEKTELNYMFGETNLISQRIKYFEENPTFLGGYTGYWLWHKDCAYKYDFPSKRPGGAKGTWVSRINRFIDGYYRYTGKKGRSRRHLHLNYETLLGAFHKKVKYGKKLRKVGRYYRNLFMELRLIRAPKKKFATGRFFRTLFNRRQTEFRLIDNYRRRFKLHGYRYNNRIRTFFYEALVRGSMYQRVIQYRDATLNPNYVKVRTGFSQRPHATVFDGVQEYQYYARKGLRKFLGEGIKAKDRKLNKAAGVAKEEYLDLITDKFIRFGKENPNKKKYDPITVIYTDLRTGTILKSRYNIISEFQDKPILKTADLGEVYKRRFKRGRWINRSIKFSKISMVVRYKNNRYDYYDLMEYYGRSLKQIYYNHLKNKLSSLSEVQRSLRFIKKKMSISGIKNYMWQIWFEKKSIRKGKLKIHNNLNFTEGYNQVSNIGDNNISIKSLNRNYYNKHYENNFYGFLTERNKLASNTEVLKNKKLLLKKEFLFDIENSFKEEELLLKNYLDSKMRFILLKINLIYFYQYLSGGLFVMQVDKEENYKILTFLGKGLGYNKIYNGTIVESIVTSTGGRPFIQTYRFLKKYNILIILFYISLFCIIYYTIAIIIILLLKAMVPNNTIFGIKKDNKVDNNNEDGFKEVQNILDVNNLAKNKLFGLKDISFNYTKILLKRKKSNSVKKLEKDIKNNYYIFYKMFTSEQNLKNFEINTKLRIDPKNFFDNKTRNKDISLNGRQEIILITRAVAFSIKCFFKDRKFNYNRKIFWENPDLHELNKIIYYVVVPHYFIFIISSYRLIRVAFVHGIKSGDFTKWYSKGEDFVEHGLQDRINYRKLDREFSKSQTIKGMRESVDYTTAIFYFETKILQTNLKKIIKDKLEDQFNKNTDINISLKKYFELSGHNAKINQILKINNQLNIYKKENIKLNHANLFYSIETRKDRGGIPGTKDNRKELIEQRIRYKYREHVLKIKMDLVDKKYKAKKNKLFVNKFDDFNKKTTVVDSDVEKELFVQGKQEVMIIREELDLRERNFKKNIINVILDDKETVFFETIRSYNEELDEAFLLLEKSKKDFENNKQKKERKALKFFSVFEESFISFRNYTTMGSRLNYIGTLLAYLLLIWFDHAKRISKNEDTLESIFILIKLDLLKYIKKIYGEYILIFKKYKAFKKLGNNIITIIQFTLFILTPLSLLACFLYIVLILYNYFKKKIDKKKLYLKNKIEKLEKKIYVKRLIKKMKLIYELLKNKISLLDIFFVNVESGNSKFHNIYIIFYKFCAIIQRRSFFTKKTFGIGYNEKGIKQGLLNVKNYGILVYYRCIEYLKNDLNIGNSLNRKNLKKIFINEIRDVLWKGATYKVKVDLTEILDKLKMFIGKVLYINIIKKKFHLDFDSYLIGMLALESYYKETITMGLKNLSGKENIILIGRVLKEFILFPFKYYFYFKNFVYVKKYIKNELTFTDAKSLTYMFHVGLNEKKFSQFLEEKKERITFFEMYKKYRYNGERIIYKDSFLTTSNARLAHQLKSKGDMGKLLVKKYRFLDKLIKIARLYEDDYDQFNRSLETRNGTFGQRMKYFYFVDRVTEIKHKKLKELDQSRDKFFNKKFLERKKIMFIYFIKGVINGITYKKFNKVFFTEYNVVKNIRLHILYKKRVFKGKNIPVNVTYHLGFDLVNIPPELGSLAIIFHIYYQSFFRYSYYYVSEKTGDFNLVGTRAYKGRIQIKKQCKPAHINDLIDFIDASYYPQMEFLHDSLSSISYYDCGERGLLSIIDNFFFRENYLESSDVGGDVSLNHILTYDKKKKRYEYEISDYRHKILRYKGYNVKAWFAKSTYVEDKLNYNKLRSKEVKDVLKDKKNVINKTSLEERRKKSIQLFKNALLNTKLYDDFEKARIYTEVKENDVTYKRKYQFFVEAIVEQILDNAVTKHRKTPEDFYFSPEFLSRVKEKLKSIYSDMYFHNTTEKLHILYDDLMFESFDQTINDIMLFLQFELIKKIERKKKKKNKKKFINYKHLNVQNPSILRRINGTLFLKRMKNEGQSFHYDITDPLIINNVFNIDVDRDLNYLTGPYKGIHGFRKGSHYDIPTFIIDDVLSGYSERNYFTFYNTLERYNLEVNVPSFFYTFYGNLVVAEGTEMIEKRLINLTELQKDCGEQKDNVDISLGEVVGYINNVKFTLDQGLGFGNIELENELVNKDLIIFLEKNRLGFLKRCPMRLKMPVYLKCFKEKVKEDTLYELKHYINEYQSDYYTNMSIKKLIAINNVPVNAKIVRLNEYIEQTYGEESKRFLFSVIGKMSLRYSDIYWENPELFDSYMDNMMDFTLIHYRTTYEGPIELLKYARLFVKEESELGIHELVDILQSSYVMNDPIVNKYREVARSIAIIKYHPNAYMSVYSSACGPIYTGSLLIGSIVCGIFFLNILFYYPGRYISHCYILIGPPLLSVVLFGFYLFARDERNISRGNRDLQLYKFQSDDQYSGIEMMELGIRNREDMEYYSEFVHEKPIEEEDPAYKFFFMERSEYEELRLIEGRKRFSKKYVWDKAHVLDYKGTTREHDYHVGDYYSIAHSNVIAYRLGFFYLSLFMFECLHGYEGSRRNIRVQDLPFIGDRLAKAFPILGDQILVGGAYRTISRRGHHIKPELFRPSTVYHTTKLELRNKTYQGRAGWYDCYDRFNIGVNQYSVGYENVYRGFKNLRKLELDDGYFHDQIIRNIPVKVLRPNANGLDKNVKDRILVFGNLVEMDWGDFEKSFRMLARYRMESELKSLYLNKVLRLNFLSRRYRERRRLQLVRKYGVQKYGQMFLKSKMKQGKRKKIIYLNYSHKEMPFRMSTHRKKIMRENLRLDRSRYSSSRKAQKLGVDLGMADDESGLKFFFKRLGRRFQVFLFEVYHPEGFILYNIKLNRRFLRVKRNFFIFDTFMKRMLKSYGYSMDNGSPFRFFIRAQAKTNTLIKRDFARYGYFKKTKEYRTAFKAYNSVLNNTNQFIGIRNNQNFDIEFSITLSREDKHLNILIYNFMKYKSERINKVLENQVIHKALNCLKQDLIGKRGIRVEKFEVDTLNQVILGQLGGKLKSGKKVINIHEFVKCFDYVGKYNLIEKTMKYCKARIKILDTKGLTKLRKVYIRATKLNLNEDQFSLPDRYCVYANEYKKYFRNLKRQKIDPDFIKKYEQHIIDTIFKEIPREDMINYKVKFGIKFLKEKEGTWYIIEKYFSSYPNSTTNSVWEALSESIDIILKIISDF